MTELFSGLLNAFEEIGEMENNTNLIKHVEKIRKESLNEEVNNMITIKQIVDKMNEWYDKIYDAHTSDELGEIEGAPGFLPDEVQQVGASIFDNYISTKHKDLVRKIVEYREDFISSDREAASLTWALHDLGLLDWNLTHTEDGFTGSLDDLKVDKINLSEDYIPNPKFNLWYNGEDLGEIDFSDVKQEKEEEPEDEVFYRDYFTVWDESGINCLGEFDTEEEAIEYAKDDDDAIEVRKEYTEVKKDSISAIDVDTVWVKDTLEEDIVKQGKKWVNKGQDGTHGKFKTKKAARQQQKAMYANGFKGESLNEVSKNPYYELEYTFGKDHYNGEEFTYKVDKFDAVEYLLKDNDLEYLADKLGCEEDEDIVAEKLVNHLDLFERDLTDYFSDAAYDAWKDRSGFDESLNKEEVKEDFNIGSNKNVEVGSEPYKRIMEVCHSLNDMDLVDKWNGKDVRFTVEETYEDYGANMKWKTIICTDEEGNSHQILSPTEWMSIANGKWSVDEALFQIMEDEYCQFKFKQVNEEVKVGQSYYLKFESKEDADKAEEIIKGKGLVVDKMSDKLMKVIGNDANDKTTKAILDELGLTYEMDESLTELEEKIVKKGDKYQVQSEKGRNLGTYDTKKEAEDRLDDVEMFKHMNEEVLDESSVRMDDIELSDTEKLILYWDKYDVFVVEKIYKPSKEEDLWYREWKRTYPTEEAARRAFNRYKKKLTNEELTEAKKAKIIDVTPNYTGGGIYVFEGALDDGTYFLACDDGYDVRILDKDPRKTRRVNGGDKLGVYPEWQEKHLVRDIDNNKTKGFFEEMINWVLKNEPKGNYNDGDMKELLVRIDDDFSSIEEDWTHDVPKKDKNFIKQEVKDTLSDVKYGTMTVNKGHERIMSAIVDTLDNPIEEEVYEYNNGIVLDEDFDDNYEDVRYFAYEIESDMSGTKVYLLHKDYDKLQDIIPQYKKDFISFLKDEMEWEDWEDKYEDKGFIIGDNETESVYQAPIDDDAEEVEWGLFYDGKPVEVIKKDHWRF